MDQQQQTASATGQPTTAPPAAHTTSYLIPLDAAEHHDLLDALRIAADRSDDNLDCPACADQSCTDSDHADWMRRVRAWRALAANIGRQPCNADDQPMIRFNPDACRAWLQAGAAQRAGIDE